MIIQVVIHFIAVLTPALTEIAMQQRGFCVISWITQEQVPETYTYTAYEYAYGYGHACGWRSTYCHQTVTKTGTRYVNNDVTQKRVECCDGYDKKLIHDDVFDCEPICVPECVDGHCSSPGNCTCSLGYKHLSSSRCVPSCDPDCVNGKCIYPGTCQCNEGYLRVNSTYCSPQCSSPCINGICIQPDECLCNNGFEKKEDDQFICQPICKNECINSTCIDINVCSCFDGYLKEDPSKPNVCVPKCTLECIHGECSGPDTCSCNEEYHLGNESWNVCIPNCNCTNGYCLKPNQCICFDNYTFDEYGECEPICNECINSTCKSPFYCECLDGFKMFNDTVCTPECSNCTNGICVEPEVCDCFPGYEDDSGECKPVCDFGCANSICTAPNVCSCEPGYEKIEQNLCFPECSSNCSNCSVTDCLIPEQTKLIMLDTHIQTIPVFRLHLRVNCIAIHSNNNNTYDFLHFEKNESEWSFLECVSIKSSENSVKFICFLKEMNYTYEFGLDNILYTKNLNILVDSEETLNTTVLLPKYLLDGEGSCQLCAYPADNSLNQTNNLTLELKPCPLQRTEHFSLITDNLYVCGGITLCVVFMLALIGSITFLYKYKFKQNLEVSPVRFADEEVRIVGED